MALIGLLLGMLWRLDWGLLWSDTAVFSTSRPGFGFPAIVFALMSGVALVGLFTFRARWWKVATAAGFGWRLSAWLVVMAFVAQAFLLTLSRGAWLALAGAVAIAVWTGRRDRPARLSNQKPMRNPLHNGAYDGSGDQRESLAESASSKLPSWLNWVFGLLLLALLALNSGPIIDRFVEEQEAVRAILSGEVDYSAESSLSQRWQAQRFGVAVWLERPWFGWGPGSSHGLIVARGGPPLSAEDGGMLDHLHNTYLELLVQFGMIGLAFWFGMFIALLVSIRRARDMGRLDADVARFLVLSIVYLSLWNLIDFHATHQAWRGLWALLAGSALSVGMFAKDSAMPESRQTSETACASR
ncbi:MAG: O-antigen ligase family protein [Thiohalocapsa sp.]